VAREFDETFWENRYRGQHQARPTSPNPHLVGETESLPPGAALDAGCGEGAEAIWLASRGWRVTAVDIAATALRHAWERAEALGDDVAGRIDWVAADLATWTPPEAGFDLVCSHYVHVPGSPTALFRRLATAVAPGGTLLIVGHDPSDPHTAQHTSAAEAYVTAEQVAATLDPATWEVVVAETRSRSATDHDGREVTLRDVVVLGRRRPS
jgi:SAM-dependent methyltransferase